MRRSPWMVIGEKLFSIRKITRYDGRDKKKIPSMDGFKLEK